MLQNGSIPLFRVAGISVMLHWSWFAFGFYEINQRMAEYPSIFWNIAEFLALFLIVLLHEFGHSFACRSVGGQAETIVLWPLGGVANVSPPPRPGALLWSIVAGPLVNVILVPITVTAYVLVRSRVIPEISPGLEHFCLSVMVINLVLLLNLLPIYPLDGGQILHALLWFIIGRAQSLIVCSIIGIIGAVVVFALSIYIPDSPDTWLIIIAIFLGLQAYGGFTQARVLLWAEPANKLLQESQLLIRDNECDEALDLCDDAMELIPAQHPARADVLACRAQVFIKLKDYERAIKILTEAIRINPRQPSYLLIRGLAMSRLKQYDDARMDYLSALNLDPNSAMALNNLAWLRATCADPEIRNGKKAVRDAERACELTQYRAPSCLGTLAAAYAEIGDFAQAITLQMKALEDPAYAEEYGADARQRLKLYQAGNAVYLT